MTSKLRNKQALWRRVVHAVPRLGACLAFALMLSSSAWAQQLQITGTVTATDGSPLTGVTVRLQGTAAVAMTDAAGKYVISAPATGVLQFALIGYRGITVTVAGQATHNVTMTPAVAVLEEVVVTGYTEQRRGDITGAVATVNTESVAKESQVSVLKGLGATTTGVTVEASGSPGSRSTVRIRGVSSFQNNDPLYIIDGTPVQDSYINWLNPNDIASIQVLKDASAASIYGSRASNGVIIIETHKRGGGMGPARATLDIRTGVATPTKGLSNVLMTNALDYFQFVKTSRENSGQPVPTNIYGNVTNPSVPAYIWPNNCGPGGTSGLCTSVDTSTYSFPNDLIMPGSAGTDWWKAIFRPAMVGDYNLAVAGGTEASQYNVSFNYLNQAGTAKYNRFQRGSVRSNTAFTRGRLNFGENLALAREQSYGGIDDGNIDNESGILGKNIYQQPVVPIYDTRGYFASGKAVGLSNLTNPLKVAYDGQNNISTNDRIFGNVFGELNASEKLSLKTGLGFNLYQGSYRGYSAITPENSEATFTNSINENYNLSTEWTWTNTLTYKGAWDRHTLNLLLGQEANKGVSRYESGSCSGLQSTDVAARYIQDALCDPTTKNVSSSGSRGSLLSFFGKADYNFADRYFLSLTLRRDGSSRLGPSNKWGTFPAVGLGWRLTNEPFLAPGKTVSSLMLRFGWGKTGNQNIPAGRIVSQFGGDRGGTFYDIGGTLTTIQPGYAVTAIGNANLKWEAQTSINGGVDMELFQSHAVLTVDVFDRNTDNLLFDPRTPATAGTASPPIVNIGKMKNTGYEVSLGYRGGTRTQWSVTLNGSHYKNQIVSIDAQGDSLFFPSFDLRQQNPVINKLGSPIGSFYGLQADGYYLDSADAAPYWDSGARPGRIKFVDTNGDGVISAADRVVIGSPHPKFQGGLDFSVRHGSWDLSATVFGTYGNKIFNAQKYWDVFGYFDTNVRKDRLTESVVLDGPCVGATCPGKVTNPDAKYPRLDASDAFSRTFSSYWVEDGSYLRLRTLQLGYNLPQSFIRWLAVARVYVQAENLLTITGYSGLDPSLPAWSAFGAAGDIRDQYRGVDGGTYPSSRTFSFGIRTSF